MSASPPLLQVTGATVRFPLRRHPLAWLAGGPRHITAVAGADVILDAGETLAIVGESGSGKTTLARAIARLGPLHQGNIYFQGRDLHTLSHRALKGVRREMAMMFQDPVGSLSPRLGVGPLLLEPFRIHGVAPPGGRRATVERLLASVNLPFDLANRYPHQLSGGQARRVGVARALALEPRLILADEPTAGLDVSVQGEVLNLLGELQDRRGLALLVITHNLHVVRHIAHRMAIMYLGRLVEWGPTGQIFHAPRHPYTKVLLSANLHPDPDAPKDRLKATGEVPRLRQRPSGCEFHPRCPMAQPRCRVEAPTATAVAGGGYRCHFPLAEA
ncbi:MAG: oligopeptide/dipeptide ABC transporter ATP-binding protein [Candidatus Competibacterales bacterium]